MYYLEKNGTSNTLELLINLTEFFKTKDVKEEIIQNKIIEKYPNIKILTVSQFMEKYK